MSNRRPPSPLRNGYTAGDDSEDGSDHNEDDDDQWGTRPDSPSPSIQKLTTNFAQRIGSLVGSVNSSTRSANGLPTDAQLEAEAERERERSRREAEMIIRREAEERRRLEDNVMAMMAEASGTVTPPRRPPSTSNSSSPNSAQKEGWFAAVKSKLTPTKEPLTPAQQIVHEMKAKEKEKKKDKGKDLNGKTSEPAFLSLSTSGVVTPQRVPASMTPESPSPAPPPFARSPHSTGNSPMHSLDSPSRDGPPMYAQFNAQGTLDVAGTLLTIARRFEKLERWTVSHVRALEDRMGDVERWLVEKEKEKDEGPKEGTRTGDASVDEDSVAESDMRPSELSDIRDELSELQGRVGELGREMARLMVAPTSAQSRATPTTAAGPAPSLMRAPSTTAASRSLPTIPVSVPRTPITPIAAPPIIPNRPTTPSLSSRPRETSPPPASNSSILSNGTGRTRLPYPTGDYTSPPGFIPTKQEVLSPTNSPPSSLTESGRRKHMSISGLPSPSLTHTMSYGELPPQRQRSDSPPVRARSEENDVESPSGRLSVPVAPLRTSKSANTSPTPRKRYTVALGGPLVPPPDDDDDDQLHRPQNRKYGAMYSTSPISTHDSGEFNYDDTIGRSSARLCTPPTDEISMKPRLVPKSPGTPRARAQSSYGPPSSGEFSATSTPSPIAPSKPKLRSRSTDRIGLGISMPNGNGNKFVDPLVIRKQAKDAVPRTPKTPGFAPGKGKVPIGELVAFFDGEKR